MDPTPKNPGQALAQALQDGTRIAPEIIEAADWAHEDAAARTKSPAFHGDNVPLLVLHRWLLVAAAACRQLDSAKRALFYGDAVSAQNCRAALPMREGTPYSTASVARNVLTVGANAFTEEQAADIIHCVLGKLTEAGELADMLIATFNGDKFDALNFVEEIGDSRWYDAIGVPAVGYTLHQTDKANEQKLTDKKAGRYKGGGFAASMAVVRNADAERETLQKSLL